MYVAYILLLLTELNKLNKWYLHSVFMLVAVSCVCHGFARARIIHW